MTDSIFPCSLEFNTVLDLDLTSGKLGYYFNILVLQEFLEKGEDKKKDP